MKAAALRRDCRNEMLAELGEGKLRGIVAGAKCGGVGSRVMPTTHRGAGGWAGGL